MTETPFDPDLLKKREELQSRGIDPYPYSFDRTHTLTQVREKQAELLDGARFYEETARRFAALTAEETEA